MATLCRVLGANMLAVIFNPIPQGSVWPSMFAHCAIVLGLVLITANKDTTK